MQEELAVAVQTARGGDRIGAVYKAHQSLENDLAKYVSLVGLATKSQNTSNSFNPWDELKNQIVHVNLSVSVCLRLFSEHRVMLSSKGCETVEALYTQKKSPSERLHSFLNLIKEKLDGMLSLSIALVGGRCLRLINPESAGFFIRSFIENVTNSDEYDARDPTHVRIKECVVGTQDMLKAELPLLLSLEVECFAECGNTMFPLDCELDRLRGWISNNEIEELLAYEVTCKRRYAETSAQIIKKAKYRESLVSSKEDALGKCYSESAQPYGNSPHEPKSIKPQETPQTSLQLLLNMFGLKGWKLHVSRLAAVVIGILLLKLFTTGALKLLKYTANVMRSAPRRQRQLTL
ncbi:unnamed protein product [Phytomonas sp. Hart1]|nr:unnamed protein product [Phytomonas sp. Hart1]|eukprot:CCW71844.1 unnamed protein product [Phytomonas sp. isolate Hart1]